MMVDEQLFACKSPKFGGTSASVLVDEDGLAIVHDLIRGQLAVPREQIAAVVLDPQPADHQVVLRRQPRRLDLRTTLLADANVLIVFDPPLPMPPFRSGAQKALGISRHERLSGLEVDAIGVTVEDPLGLAHALTSLGAHTELTTTAAFISVVGQAYGPEADTLREHERRRTRGRLTKSLALTPLFTLALAGRLALVDHHWDDVRNFAGVGAAAIGWCVAIAVLVAVALAHRVGDTGPASIRSPRKVVVIACAPTVMVLIPMVLRGWIHTHLGIPPTVTTGLAAGLPGGAWAGWLLHRLGRNAATSP